MKNLVKPWLYKEEVLLSEQFAYGNREILLTCNGIKLDQLILGELQHGWTLDVDELKQSRSRLRSIFGKKYPLYVWSEDLRSRFEDAGHRDVYSIGSPWAHYVQAHGSIAHRKNSFTVYFPSHSYYGADVSNEFVKSIQEIEEIVESSKVIVCLYWIDFIDPRKIEFFVEMGWNAICLGYRGAPSTEFPWSNVGGRINFLPNLLELLTNSQLVISDEIGTAFWAANSLGINTYLTRGTTTISSVWPNKIVKQPVLKFKQVEKFCKEGVSIAVGEILCPQDGLFELSRIGFGWESTKHFTEVVKMKKSELLIDTNISEEYPIRTIGSIISH